jgi:hypothetical protein
MTSEEVEFKNGKIKINEVKNLTGKKRRREVDEEEEEETKGMQTEREERGVSKIKSI